MPERVNDFIDLEDRELLALLTQDHESAFRALYDRYANTLYNMAFKRLPVSHKAEDIIQEVFVTLFKKRHEMSRVNDLRAWLFACTRNRILNEIRNYRSHLHHHSQAANTLESTSQLQGYDMKVLEGEFHKTLEMLTSRCRQVFLLSRREHLPNKAIAKKLQVSTHTVEKHITNALRIMRQKLGSHEPGMLLIMLMSSLNCIISQAGL